MCLSLEYFLTFSFKVQIVWSYVEKIYAWTLSSFWDQCNVFFSTQIWSKMQKKGKRQFSSVPCSCWWSRLVCGITLQSTKEENLFPRKMVKEEKHVRIKSVGNIISRKAKHNFFLSPIIVELNKFNAQILIILKHWLDKFWVRFDITASDRDFILRASLALPHSS